MIINKKRSQRAGFSFIEISVVLLIVGFLMAAVISQISKVWYGANTNAVKSQLNSLKVSIMQYHSDNHQYPRTLQDLVTRPSDSKITHWKRPYIEEKELQDPWGTMVFYKLNAPGAGKKPFELYSWGEHGEGSPKEEWFDVWDL